MASRYVDNRIDDDEIPELTEEDFARTIPFAELPKEEREFLRQIKTAGIQRDPLPEEEVTLELSRPVLEKFRASGEGWESTVDEALRQWLAEHQAS